MNKELCKLVTDGKQTRFIFDGLDITDGLEEVEFTHDFSYDNKPSITIRFRPEKLAQAYQNAVNKEAKIQEI